MASSRRSRQPQRGLTRLLESGRADQLLSGFGELPLEQQKVPQPLSAPTRRNPKATFDLTADARRRNPPLSCEIPDASFPLANASAFRPSPARHGLGQGGGGVAPARCERTNKGHERTSGRPCEYGLLRLRLTNLGTSRCACRHALDANGFAALIFPASAALGLGRPKPDLGPT
jgi:hypothetical protein